MKRPHYVLGLVCAAWFACVDPGATASGPSGVVVELRTDAISPDSSVRVTLYNSGSAPDAVIVFLHGVGGSDGTWAELGGPTALAAATRRAGGASHSVAVAAVRGDTLGWPERLDGTVSWERFLSEDLPTFLREEFGAHLTSERIAYLGTSAGGAKAITMALHQPNAFGCVAAHSPAVHPPDPSHLPA